MKSFAATRNLDRFNNDCLYFFKDFDGLRLTPLTAVQISMSKLNNSHESISKDEANVEETQQSIAPAEKSKRNRVPPNRYGVEENELNDDVFFSEILIQTSMPSAPEMFNDSVQSCSSWSGIESNSSESETESIEKQPGKRKKSNAPQAKTQTQTQKESEIQQTMPVFDKNDDDKFESIIEITTDADKDVHTSENQEISENDELSPGEKILFRMICDLSKEVKVLNKTVASMEVKQHTIHDVSQKIEIDRMNSMQLEQLGLPLKSEGAIKKFEADLENEDFSEKMVCLTINIFLVMYYNIYLIFFSTIHSKILERKLEKPVGTTL